MPPDAGSTNRKRAPWWEAGLWLGPAGVGHQVCAELPEVSGAWVVTEDPSEASAVSPSVVVNAAALGGQVDLEGVATAIEALAGSPRPPARIVTVVTASWLGRGPSPAASARAGFLVSHSRHLALRLAPTSTTVNVVAVPDGFPQGATGGHAPVPSTPGPAELAHVLRYFGHPDNGYVLGQLISLCGGDDVWSNHSA